MWKAGVLVGVLGQKVGVQPYGDEDDEIGHAMLEAYERMKHYYYTRYSRTRTSVVG